MLSTVTKEPKEMSFDEFGLDKPHARTVLAIDVEISSENLLSDYSKALVLECARLNPLLAKELKLTPAEILKYCEFLLQRRIEIVNETITDYHKVRQLYIPYWMENCLSQIGIVRIKELGYELTPVYSAEVISLEEARAISDRLSYYKDELELKKRVMPKDREGSPNVMTLSLVAAQVAGLNRQSTPEGVVMARFLGLKLLQESTFEILYRVNYGDIRTVTTAASTRKVWFGR